MASLTVTAKGQVTLKRDRKPLSIEDINRIAAAGWGGQVAVNGPDAELVLPSSLRSACPRAIFSASSGNNPLLDG